jgi:dienelactone hydrolase
VAVLDPVPLGGVTVGRATLHNRSRHRRASAAKLVHAIEAAKTPKLARGVFRREAIMRRFEGEGTVTIRVGTVTIRVGTVTLNGNLVVPGGAHGLVLFAHGSGSSRLSPRNRFVAEALRDEGLGTLLFDLLTPEEARGDEVDGRLRFDIPLLASRLLAVTHWVHTQAALAAPTIGYFGASTGAAAALIAAAEGPKVIGAVVSRGGRPDLSGEALARVRAPTLLIVGGDDKAVLGLNQEAQRPSSWRLFLGRRTCSRSPVRSRRLRACPEAGSGAISSPGMPSA